MSDSPEAYLKEAYLGEVGGQASFAALAEHMPERADALGLLAQVEAVTAAYLKPHLLGAIDEAEVTARAADGRARVEAFSKQTWLALMQGIAPIVADALDQFKAAEATAPAELLDVYRHFTAHEQALADFITCELDGRDGCLVLREYIEATPTATA